MFGIAENSWRIQGGRFPTSIQFGKSRSPGRRVASSGVVAVSAQSSNRKLFFFFLLHLLLFRKKMLRHRQLSFVSLDSLGFLVFLFGFDGYFRWFDANFFSFPKWVCSYLIQSIGMRMSFELESISTRRQLIKTFSFCPLISDTKETGRKKRWKRKAPVCSSRIDMIQLKAAAAVSTLLGRRQRRAGVVEASRRFPLVPSHVSINC